jgi:aminodeoxyfutalosine deaminase
MTLTEYIRRLPKAELHLHLEGSGTGRVISELGRKYGTEFAGMAPEEIERKTFAFEDFKGFLLAYGTICAHLREAADYLFLLDLLVDYLKRENIRYAEVITSPSIAARFGLDGEAVLAALLERSADIEATEGIMVRWILDCVRNYGPEPARQTAEMALRYRDRGVVAIGLGGDENSFPMKDFEGTFRWAKANGLFIHCHAGEIGGVEQVWDAVTLLGANRIGHGIQAARDAGLMEHLREHAIALDICLTSNVRTRAWAPISAHPFQLLFKRGVPVTLNTDDPGIFQTTLGEEYAKAFKHFGLTRTDLNHIALQGVRSAFLPATLKNELMQTFQDEIHELQ